MRLWPFVACLLSISLGASAAEIAGIKLPERAKLGTCELVLNGAGLRKKLFFKVYIASLYLAEKRSSPAEVLALDGPKRVSIILLRTLPAQDLVDALNEGIRENSSPGELQTVQGRFNELTATMLAVQEGKKGDVISVDWRPDAGTFVLLNGEPKGKPIPGEDVYRALLKAWLGEHPSSARLKKALLGQTN